MQRVSSSRVEVDGTVVGEIQKGWLILLAVGREDTQATTEYMADRCVKLRAFPDENGKMNLSVVDVGGSMLVVSQFTLYGDCIRGRRPGFDRAAPPEHAKQLYEYFCQLLRGQGVSVEQGVFQADMKVHLVNDGPVTFVIEKSP
ncbi:MAG: D-aminoacyl-tRNA deacylase [Pirellula sp.]